MINLNRVRLIVLVACLLGAALLPAQHSGPDFRLLTRLPVAAKFFTTDKLQQLYLVTPRNEVIKYDSDGRELFRYNNNTLGNLRHIDATNPFNLLLFYPDFQTAITLDRTLNKIGEFVLWNLDVVDVRAVAMAVDNGIWLYDGGDYRLRLIGQDGEMLRRSDNLNLLLSVAPAPVTLLARDNFVYANDPSLGILIFDNFGQFVRTLSLPGITDLQVLDERLIFRRDDTYFAGDLLGLREAPLPLPPGIGDARQVRLGKDRMFVLREDGVEIYGIDD